jgi:hypothetical protein
VVTGGHRLAGAWHAFGATARGALHEQTGLPNQDSHQIASTQRGLVILSAADGHGDRRCVRADVGAQLAVRAAVDCAQLYLDDKEGGQQSGTGLAVAITRAWNAAVDEHFDRHSWTDAERLAVGSPLDHRLAYGSTLLLAAVADSQLTAVQIGDGDILAISEDGTMRRPLTQPNSLVAGETWSIASPDAAERALSIEIALEDLRMVLVATDGYANSFATDDWDVSIGTDYLQLVDDKGAGWVASSLQAWVEASAHVAGDDVTVLVTVRGGSDG